MSPEKLETRFDEWQAVRTQQAKTDFEALLKENKFVDFWGRLKNKAMAAAEDGEAGADDEDEDEGEGGGGNANLDIMAKQVDLKEMHDVLKVSLIYPFTV